MSGSFEEWITEGIEKGWCGPPVCETHDGVPTSEDEDRQYDEGFDPCVHIVRLYADADTKKAVEASHAPSQWRNHYTNLPPGSSVLNAETGEVTHMPGKWSVGNEEEAALKFKLELATTEAEGGSEYPPGYPELGG